MDLGIRSHRVWESHLPARSDSLDFHRVVPNLVLNTVGIVCWVRRAFEVFDNSDQDVAQFVKLRGFPRCDQPLVPWPCDIELKLFGYRVPLNTRVYLRSRQAKCSLVTWLIAWLLMHVKLCDLRFWMLLESCIPPSLFWTKCPGCKML
jgi:hypothetical protein